MPDSKRTRTPHRGAVLIVFTIALMSLTLLFGLALDGGILYMARASLSKGVDAAALMGARQLSQGEASAQALAQSAFQANYQASSLPLRQAGAPQLTVSFTTDDNGIKRINVQGRVLVNTFIIGVLPQFATVTVGASAQALRAKLVMGIVLDRSGSMLSNGGATALPPAVVSFIHFFDDSFDRVALSSYADHARLDVSLRYDFKTPITTAVQTMTFGGYTYTHGGLDIARTQVNSVPFDPNDNVLHVAVLFTDGQANSFLASTRCSSTSTRDLVLVPGSGSSDFRNPSTGSTVSCSSSTTGTFYSQKYQANRTRNSSNVTEEGLWRAENSASLIRQDGTLVFAIGLGNTIDKASLRKIANDRSSASFNPAQPEGLAVFAPTASDLDAVFKQIASRILLRLTQ